MDVEARTIQGGLSGIGDDLDLDAVTAAQRLVELADAFGSLEPMAPDDPAQLSVLGQTIANIGGGACFILDEEGVHPDSGIIDW